MPRLLNGVNAFLKKKNLRLPLHHHSRRRFPLANAKYGIFAVVGLAIGIAALNFFGQDIKNTAYVAALPLQKVFWQAGVGTNGFATPFFSSQALSEENANLKQENEKLLAQIAAFQNAATTNAALQEALAATKDDQFTLVLAQPLGVDANQDTILINRGSDDNIQENMPIISSTKVLYGKVSKVYKNFSQVTLISNANSVVAAKILSAPAEMPDTAPTPITGAIKGSGNLSLYLDLISSDAILSEGDTLVTSGLEGTFPKDLLIGKITSKNQSDAKPFQTAAIKPFFDIQSVENLFIVTNYRR